MVNNKDEASLKTVVGNLADEIEVIKEKLDNVASAQEKVNHSLQEFATARRTGTPVQFMKADIVEKTIKDNLNSQLVNSTVKVEVKDPVATIGKQATQKIDDLIATSASLISSTKSLTASIEALKPRRPLINVKIYDGKSYLWVGLCIAVICLVWGICAIVGANKKLAAIQEQAPYWGDRAYQAAILRELPNPGEHYHHAVVNFKTKKERVKRIVKQMEDEAQDYQEVKHYLLSIIGNQDSRDIQVINWEGAAGERFIRFRYYDEEVERSVHIWKNGKAEETTDKYVTDLASAQKYSKRKIWRTLRESTDACSSG